MFGNHCLRSILKEVDPDGARGPFRGGEPPLSDADIRSALARRSCGWAEEQVVIPEVECWRGYVRADYVLVSDGTVSIVEIKSDRDTFRRFGDQARVYSAIADRVTLIVGWVHAARALRSAPEWWEVVLAEREPQGDVRFVPLRDGAPNPGITAAALVAMLPVDALRQLGRDAERGAGPRRGRDLREYVTERVSCDDLRAAVREWLLRRSRARAASASSPDRASDTTFSPAFST
jgi:hypothetical protein